MEGREVGLGLEGRGCHSGVRCACPLPPTCTRETDHLEEQERQTNYQQAGPPNGRPEGERLAHPTGAQGGSPLKAVKGKGLSSPSLLLFRYTVVSSSSVTPQTVACQAPLSMGFPRQEYWSGCPFLLQGIFLTQGWNLCLLHWQLDSSPPHHRETLGSSLGAGKHL